MKHFDVICIGTGGAGNTAAFKLASEGKKVLICDPKPYGGTCAISGCDPKKVMITAAEFADFNSRMMSKGVTDSLLKLSWRAMMAHKREFTSGHSEKLTYKYNKAGITHINAKASFASADSVEINGEIYTFQNAVIATGSKSSHLPFEGFEMVCDNECFLDLDELPERLLFIGGGYISVEFANIAAAFGAKCTIVQVDGRLVPNFEPELGDILTDSLTERGVEIITNARVKSIAGGKDGYSVTVDTLSGGKNLMADLVIHGAGRTANLDGLHPEKAGVETTARGVRVNEFMQTSNPDVYAGGDCADTEGYMLSPIAFMEGYTAAMNILNGNTKKPDYSVTGTAMFNVPALASVGHTEKTANDAGLDFRVSFQKTAHWFTSFRTMEKFSAYKILTDNKTNQVIGAHVIGPHAEDVINVFVAAMKSGMTVSDMKKVLYAYPTASSDIIHML
jgi:glutathione reductase (NADPH)